MEQKILLRAWRGMLSCYGILPVDQPEVTNKEQRYGINGPNLSREGQKKSRWAFLTATLAARAILLLSINVFLYWYSEDRRMSDKLCAQQLSPYSPMLDAIEYQTRMINVPFSDDTNIFRGAPTAEGDCAWVALYDYLSTTVPVEKLSSLRKSPLQQFQPAPPPATGVQAKIQVFHQIHCLDMIRKFVWLDHYNSTCSGLLLPSQFQNHSRHYIRTHIDHCVEALRVELMCQSDVSLYLAEYKRDPDGTERWEADFNTLHKCRNYDRICDWYIQRIVREGRSGAAGDP